MRFVSVLWGLSIIGRNRAAFGEDANNNVEPSYFAQFAGDDAQLLTGEFEPWVRRAHEAAQSSGLDFRFAKALGPKGYNKIRLSVIGSKNDLLDAEGFDYAAPFQYRWQAAYDLGTAKTACSAAYSQPVQHRSDGECLKSCSADSSCLYFTYFHNRTCSLASECDYAADSAAKATYHKTNENYLYSSVLDAQPGLNEYDIAGQTLSVTLPEEDGPVSGIIWSDPCFSSRWIPCEFGRLWSTQNRSIEMINALAEDDSWHFFQILGDNFYDQDGRLTSEMFRGFSDKVKSKFLFTVSGKLHKI